MDSEQEQIYKVLNDLAIRKGVDNNGKWFNTYIDEKGRYLKIKCKCCFCGQIMGFLVGPINSKIEHGLKHIEEYGLKVFL